LSNDEGKEEFPKEEVVDVEELKKGLVNQEYSPNSLENNNYNNNMSEDYEDRNNIDFSSSSLPLSSKNTKSKNTNTFSLIEEQLSPSLMSELSRHAYKFTRYNPLQLTIAHCDEKKIFHAYVKNDNNKDIDGSSTEYLKLTDVIIYAVPKQVILFDNPIDRNRKVQIQFESKSTKRSFTIGPGTITSIVEELQNRNMLIKRAAAMDALTAIISAFERDGKGIINDNITTPGYYFMDRKLVTYEITQDINKYPEQSKILQCVNLLDELSQKYKNKDICPTVIKWAVVAPFSFILKGNDNWMPWLQPYGITKS
jgi:hypothetical protein